MKWNDENLIKILQGGGIVVMPTDTIYGMLGKANDPEVVNHLYEIRKRDPQKPFIILIGNINELEKFSIRLSLGQKEKLKEFWSFGFVQDFRPIVATQDLRPVSIVLDCSDESLSYLHRGTNSLAFRLPANPDLRDLLLKTGPLVAPSANLEKFPQSENIEDAKKYFGDLVDLYVDGGSITSQPSKIIRLHDDGSITVLRE